MRDFILLFLCGTLITGCTTSALKPGSATTKVSQTNIVAELVQSENPQAESTQVVERESVYAPTNTAYVFNPAVWPSYPVRTVERVTTTIGAAQKDTSREIAAKLAATRPALWVGIGFIVLAGVFAWKAWFTPAAISAGVGLSLMLFSQAIATHTTLMLIIAGAALAIFVVFRAYDKGKLDSILPDNLDRNPTKE